MNDEFSPLPTPLPQPPCCAYHQGCVQRIEKLEQWRDAANDVIIVGLGKNGRNGRMGEIMEDVKELRDDVKANRAAIARLMLWVMAAAGSGAGVGGALVKLLGG